MVWIVVVSPDPLCEGVGRFRSPLVLVHCFDCPTRVDECSFLLNKGLRDRLEGGILERLGQWMAPLLTSVRIPDELLVPGGQETAPHLLQRHLCRPKESLGEILFPPYLLKRYTEEVTERDLI